MDHIKEIKHEFMAFRNGIISDALRKVGMPYDIIFGLQLPQLAQIANVTKSALDAEEGSEKEKKQRQCEIAAALWNDNKIRESRLLAFYLYPIESVDENTAMKLASEVLTREEADILCFRLLRRLPFANELLAKIQVKAEITENQLMAYCSEALLRNLS